MRATLIAPYVRRSGGSSRQDRVHGGPHAGHRLLVGKQDVGAEAAEDGASRAVFQLGALAHPGPQLGQGGALGQSFRRQGVLERLDQGSLLEGDVVAVEGLGRRQHVGSGLHQCRVCSEDGDAGAGRDQAPPRDRVQHLLVHVVEVGLGQLGRTRGQCGLRGRDEARELQPTDRGQCGRLGQEPRARRKTAAPSSCRRDSFEPVGHVRVGAEGGLGRMPRLDLGQAQLVGGGRQRPVRPPSLGSLGGVVGGRADQRVPEPDRVVDLDQPGRLGLVDRILRQAPGLAGCPDEVDVAGGVGRGDQQPHLQVG